MGTTLFKDAKTLDDYSQVVSEFKQAADLAPQWPEARYNLALAKEAAGDYSGAEADLKAYQQFKLSADEARTVQDKIYALEAKQTEATKRAADAQAKAQQEAARQQAEERQRQMENLLKPEWRANPNGTGGIVPLGSLADDYANRRETAETSAQKAEALIQIGADPNMKDSNGKSPISEAAMMGDVALVQVLIKHGADVNGRGGISTGATALESAIFYHQTDVVNILLANGADPNLQDTTTGMTALDIAKRRGYSDVIQILKSHNAR